MTRLILLARMLAGRCRDWRYAPGDLGRPIQLWCDRHAGHVGPHEAWNGPWGRRTW